MNAQEAQSIAIKTNIEATNGQYAKIQKLIRDKASNGLYEVYFYETIIDDVKSKLQNDGFVIKEHSDFRDGYTATIDWYKNK